MRVLNASQPSLGRAGDRLKTRQTARERRAVLDRAAWATIDSSLPALPREECRTRRPSNYEEMWEAVEAYVPHSDDALPLPGTWPAFEHAFSEFLHEFYGSRRASHFSVAPPDGFGTERCALLAGVADYLCRRYDLDLPGWIGDPRYCLQALWDPLEDICPDLRPTRYRRCQMSEPEFLRRNVVFEARNLITL